MSTATIPERQQFLVPNLTWDQYLDAARAFEGRSVRLTYDRGRLELMALSLIHELLKKLLDRLFVVLSDEFDVPRQSVGSTNFGREDLDRGLELEEWYYLINEPLIRGREEIDLTIDPPPDLAIDIEITHSLLDRLAILAALGVPEVWRYDGQRLRVLELQDGEYVEADESRYFPGFPLSEIENVLSRRREADEKTLVGEFRQRVREWLASQRS